MAMPNALYTSSEFKFAQYYLNYRPIEPSVDGLPQIPVSAHEVYGEQISLGDIWGFLKYVQFKYREDFVLYCHGVVTQSARSTGLSLVLDRAKPIELTKNVVELLLNEKGLSAEARRTKLGLNKLTMNTVDMYLSEIQVASFTHLALRACSIGKDEEYLLMLAKLFNAKRVSAPMQRDFFTKCDFYKLSMEDMDKLIEVGSHLKSYEEKAAQIAAAKSKAAKAKIKEQGLTVFGSGAHRAAIFVQKNTHTTFNTLGFATSAAAVEAFYAAKFRCQAPVRFTEADFEGDASASAQPAHMVGKSMGLFGLSRGCSDIIKFPNDPEYTYLIKVVENPDYIGDVPMYVAPLPSGDDLIELNLRQRLLMRVQKVVGRFR
jgi:hypothetical protein